MAFLTALCIVLVIALILTAGIQPESHEMSTDELERLKAKGNKNAADTLRREALLPSIIAMLQVCIAFLLATLAYVVVLAFGWLWGVIAMLVIILEYGSVARLAFVRRFSHQLYTRYEPVFLKAASRYKNGAFRLVQNAETPRRVTHRIDSLEELAQLIAHSNALSLADKTLVTHALAFRGKKVSDIMTPRKNIATIDSGEVLGPLVLDDLHKAGQPHFVVMHDKRPVGILSIERLLTINTHTRTMTAEKAMEAQIVYISSDQSLQEAVRLLTRTHAQLLLVKDEDEIKGTLTEVAIINKLTGWNLDA